MLPTDVGGHGRGATGASTPSPFAHPGAVYRYGFCRASAVFRQPTVAFDPAVFETIQSSTSSKDGTKIPMLLNYKKVCRRCEPDALRLRVFGLR